MSAIQIAAAICKQFEGFRGKPYRCPANVPTIGFGSTAYENGKRVTMADAPIDRTRATDMLYHELKRCEAAALKYCPVLVNSDSKLAAIIDFVYNLGPGRLQASTLRRKINRQDWVAAKRELMKWVRGGGKVLPGLVKRRQVEAGLF
jgi:lysozyme